MWQETGSVLAKRTCLWGIRDHGHVILGHCSWEWDRFCHLSLEKLFFLCLSWCYHWHCCRICPYVFLKQLVIAWPGKRSSSALSLLTSFPPLFSLVPQIPKWHQLVRCGKSSNGSTHSLVSLEAVKPQAHQRALMEQWVRNAKFLSTAWWLSRLTVALKKRVVRGGTRLVIIPELYSIGLEGALTVI